jgi:hypothetical protein
MANENELARFRRMIGEPAEDSTYTDTELLVLLASVNDDFNTASIRIWDEKMSVYAELVDTTEAGSSRKNSALYDRAKERRDYFASLGTGDVATPTVVSSTTRRIERV